MVIRFFKIILVFILLFCANYSFSQNRMRRTNNFKNYKDHVNEIGYSVSISYLKYEARFAPYLYLHYAHKLNDILSIGLGYGSIYDKHYHNFLNLETAFSINDQISMCLKPGFAFKNIEGNSNWSYSMGVEVVYEFKITDIIHIGPCAEITFLQDDTNYLLGFHMGFTY